jgi:hypothetical protein
MAIARFSGLGRPALAGTLEAGMPRFSAAFLGVIALAAAARATAQETGEPVAPEAEAIPAITLSVPDGCPDRVALEAEIASLLGRPFSEIAIPPASRAALSITRDEDRYVLVLTSESGERTLRDPSCAALVRAAALIVALQIDADVATLAAAAAAEAAQVVEEPVVPLPPVPAVERSRRSRFILDRAARLGDPTPPFRLPGLALGVGIALDAGLVPSVAASFFADVVVRVDRFELRARIAYAVEQGQPAGMGVRASAALGTLLGCGRPFDTSFPLAFCGGLEGGDLFARSVGVSNPAASDGGFLSAVVGAWLPLFPWPGIELALGVEGWAHVTRPLFQVAVGSSERTLYAPDPYGGRFALAIHWNP